MVDYRTVFNKIPKSSGNISSPKRNINIYKKEKQISRPSGNSRNTHNKTNNQECKIAPNKGDKHVPKPPGNDRNIHNNVSIEE